MTRELPLAGRCIVLTRQRSQSKEFQQLLESKGARVIVAPTIRIEPLGLEGIRSVWEQLASSDWVFFTSVNAVDVFLDALNQLGEKSLPERVRLAAVGPSTAARLQARGLTVSLIAKPFTAEGLLQSFLVLYGGRIENLAVIIPCASGASRSLPKGLEKSGAKVHTIHIYDTVPDEKSRNTVRSLLKEPHPDMVTFTSPSTARFFAELAGPHSQLSLIRAGAIGPVTAAAVRELGLRLVCVAEQSTVPGFVKTIQEFFADPRPA